jgi:hypothetical protein
MRDVRVRRPAAGRSGTEHDQDLGDGQGRTLCSGMSRPGRVHDQTVLRTEGVAECFRRLSAATQTDEQEDAGDGAARRAVLLGVKHGAASP